MDRLEKLVKRHEQGDLPRVDWLDNLAFRKIEQLHTSIKSHGQVSEDVFIYIDFPRFDFPVVFSELEYPPPLSTLHASTPNLTAKGIVEDGEGGTVCGVWDPEGIKDNPVEAKHRRLVRSHRSGPLDKDLKPNAKIRDELNVSSFVYDTNARKYLTFHQRKNSLAKRKICFGNSDSISQGIKERLLNS